MLDELKNQQRELNRKLKTEREKAVEKALRDFMNLILDNRMPMEIKKSTMIETYKTTMISIFSD